MVLKVDVIGGRGEDLARRGIEQLWVYPLGINCAGHQCVHQSLGTNHLQSPMTEAQKPKTFRIRAVYAQFFAR